MRAGIYVRVSSTKQSILGTSLETQEAGCRAAAIDAGDNVQDPHVWRDTSSGATEERQGLAQMRSAAKASLIDTLWVYEWDRLSREPIDLLKIMSELAEHGVAVRFVRGTNHVGDDARILTYVEGWVGAQERRSIVERSTRSKWQMARDGYLAHGDCGGVYGYDYDQRTKTRAVNAGEAAIVQEIFDRAAHGDSFTSIAVDLQKRGVPTKRGGRWDNATVQGILRRTAYYGLDYYGRTRVTSVGTRTQVPREEWVPVTTFSPPIITKHQFDAAQTAVQARNGLIAKKNAYLLTGFTKCGHCHGPVIGRSSKYYMCSRSISRSDRPRQCRAPNIRKDHLESVVWQVVNETIREYRVVEEALAVHPEIDSQSLDSEIARAKRQLAQIERQQNQLMNTWQSDGIPEDVFRAGLTKLKEEWDAQDHLTKDLEGRRQRSIDQETLRKTFASRCRAVAERLDTCDHEQQREVLNTFGVKVRATSTEIAIDIAVHPDIPSVPIAVQESLA